MKYLNEVKGKECIVARIVADSVSQEGDRITTFELEYHRFIHSELMTHRVFSRNAMSSRAVPIEKMIEQVKYRPATPIEWGKNTKGMQAKEMFTSTTDKHTCEYLWLMAARAAVEQAEILNKKGLHKQIVNRLLEPFQVMKTVVTATEFDNFFYLRNHADAQPEIKELAKCMWEAYKGNKPELLKDGEWHTPYVDHFRASDGAAFLEYHSNRIGLTVEEALKVSSSCCAQVSFRQCDDSLDKAINIYDRLVESKPVHASPFEHCATPLIKFWDCNEYDYSKGTTHVDMNGNGWSGNFKGWIQYRQLIPNNVCTNYKEE